jgi:hypothetical protein
MNRAAACLLALIAALCVCVPARAARPMVTDDARIVDAKACQVESWVRRNRDWTELWALPACNPTGDVELTFGGARTRENGDSAFTDHVIQAKTIFRPLDERGWGYGLAVGTFRHPHREAARGWPGDTYFYVPVSFKALGDDWIVHVNAGATRHRDEGRTITTWGVGNEVRLRDDLFFIPEMFALDRGRLFYQAGLRYWAIKDRVQIDATYGNRAVSDTQERWFSIGLRLLSPPFIP